LGALFDEYERAAREFAGIVAEVEDDQFTRLRDSRAVDDDCRSVQTVVRHVVSSGFGYATALRKHFGEPVERPEVPLATRDQLLARLDEMLRFSEETLAPHWDRPASEIDNARIVAPWGVVYDVEQLLEHAVVHVLRHRRQIEKLLQAG
jgi:uncharacterized damage-inducible protein DinB